jgi:hypothetical protein
MADIAYKPTSPYNEANATVLQNTRINLESGIVLNGRRICLGDDGISPSTTIVYTVPQGKTFFLVSDSISTSASAGSGNATLSVGPKANGEIIDEVYSATGGIYWRDHTKTFPYPIKLLSGENITFVLVGASTDGAYSIQGYEVDSSLLQSYNI